MTTQTDTRQIILDTAARLFHHQSYTAVGVASICKQADVSKGSFFHFFKSKQDLAIAVMQQFEEQINNTLIAKSFTEKLSPLKRLDQFIKELYKFQKTQMQINGHLPGCPFGNMAMEQSTQDELIRQKASACLNGLSQHFASTIKDAIKAGELPKLNVKATADAMVSYIEGIQLLAKSRNDPELIRKLGPAISSIKIA